MSISSYRKNNHCSYCGQPFAADQTWPRQCKHCQNTSFLNPLPVSVLLIPVDDGILTVRRGIPPRQGMLALPGGYIEIGESWEVAGAREAFEEAGVAVDPAQVKIVGVYSGSESTLIIVGQAAPLRSVDLPAFIPTPEASERVIVREPVALAFPLHTQALAQYLQQNR